MNKNYTIPNALSLVRLIMIPLIIVTYLKGHYTSAFILLCISGLTDMADGFIARNFNQISDLGKILDPLADKLTMASVVLCLSFNYYQIRVLLIVLIVKELLTLTGAYVLIKMGKRPAESKIWGKLSTFMLYFLMTLLMVSDAVTGYTNNNWEPSATLLWVFTAVSCFFMVMALVQYYPIFIGIKSGKYDIEAEDFVKEKKRFHRKNKKKKKVRIHRFKRKKHK